MKNFLKFAVAAAIVVLALWSSTPAAARIPFNCLPTYSECGATCNPPGVLVCCFSGRAYHCACENGIYQCPGIQP